MIRTLHKMGVRSGAMYTAGILSIATSVAAWLTSKQYESAGIDRADRWGLFVGQWAPTFFAMGLALRLEETHTDVTIFEETMDTGHERERVGRMPSRAGASR